MEFVCSDYILVTFTMLLIFVTDLIEWNIMNEIYWIIFNHTKIAHIHVNTEHFNTIENSLVVKLIVY